MSSNRFEPIRQALRSTAIRQALILLGIFALFTSIIWLATYAVVVRDTQKLVKDRLDTLVNNAEQALETSGTLPETQSGQYLLVLEEGNKQRGEFPDKLSLDNKPAGFHHMESSVGSGQTDYVVLIRNTNTARIHAAENIERLEDTTDIFLAGLQFALLTSLLATFVAGFWIARRHQARLDKISEGLKRVSSGELSSRIQLKGPKDDDLSLLADRIDETTSRLESTMTQMRVQTANIAHDLRTPLARLRAMLEEGQNALVEKNQAVGEDVLEDALAQIDKIVDTFNAILRIARIESGAQKASFVSLSLSDLANIVRETFGPVVEDHGQSLVVEIRSPGTVKGDRDMIIQLLGNLIQNSLRHGAKEQQITLRVEGLQLSVSDQGPGIPVEERDRVLQPLYQREKQRQSEGVGLGLALVNAICDLHNAVLTLNDGPDGVGFRVSVTFPDNRDFSI